MKRLFKIAAAALFLTAAASCSKADESPRLSDAELVEQFSDPSNDWRGKPFWSWNGKLEKDELIRQVGVLKDMGFGGYFMHSRVGLATEYLGEEWFDLINSTADAGTELGMINYLYDEDRWPSGTAGGYVTMKPEYRQRNMHLSVFPKSADMELADTLVAAFTCTLNDYDYTDLQRVHSVQEAMDSKGETVLAFHVRESGPSNFYNGFTMVDAMQREATDYYIELTHEAYRKNCGDRIGSTITGIFTDEPYRGAVFPVRGLSNAYTPWTDKMPEEYAKRFGGDIIDQLPAIFLHPEGKIYSKSKWQYIELTQELFLENFLIPQHEWCRKNGIAYTGHYLHEDNLTSQVVNQGSLMRDYEHQDIPGIDNLTQYSRCYWAAKQLQSVSRQTGKKMLLSELYGCSGWQMSFEDYKDAGDWQALFGINVRCPHLSWYTMKGEAKRDYPASINFQSGWYKDFKYVEDYYARLGLLLAQGEADCDLLVISPIESVFAQVAVDAFNHLSPASESMHKIEGNYSSLFRWIEGAQVDFDYADEEMMSRLCSVGKAKDGTPILNLGKASYKAVLVGNMATMRSSTLSILQKFAAKGGKIILAGDAPFMVDVEESDKASSFLEKTALCTSYDCEGVRGAIDEVVNRMAMLSCADEKALEDIFCQVRVDGDRSTYVFMSMDSKKEKKGVTINLPRTGELTRWDCRTGEVASLGNTDGQQETSLTVDFAPLQEYVFTISKAHVTESLPADSGFKADFAAPDKDYEYSLNEPNVLPLDFVTFKAEGLDVKTPTEVLAADRAIRRHFGLKYRGGDMLQPWFFAKFVGDSKPSYGPVTLAYSFNVDVIPEGDIHLCIEGAEDFAVSLNGTAIDVDSDQWWIDPCYSKVLIDKSLLVKGVNTVTLVTDFTEDKNLEAMYIIGDFGVSLSGSKTSITTLPSSLKIGDATCQGLPFYSGTISYNFGKVDATSVKVEDFEGACVKVRRGGQSTMVAYAPFVQKLPETDGDLWLDAVLTRRNTFGPFHLAPKEQPAIGPEHFVVTGRGYTDDYVIYPSGILSAPEFAR